MFQVSQVYLLVKVEHAQILKNRMAARPARRLPSLGATRSCSRLLKPSLSALYMLILFSHNSTFARIIVPERPIECWDLHHRPAVRRNRWRHSIS